ncbi:hypothetical protein [Mycobacterium sp.]
MIAPHATGHEWAKDGTLLRETLVATVAQTPGLNPTVNQAKVVVWSAEWHFCPSYY